MALGLCAVHAYADDPVNTGGQVNFTGSVNASTCHIDGQNDLNVTMPTVQVGALKAGGNAGDTRFQIHVKCDDGETNKQVRAAFAGPNLDPNTGNLKNTADAGSNVEIGLLNADDKSQITVGDQTTVTPVPITGGAATMTYFARYSAANGDATKGAVQSNATYTLDYE
ncbi:fimbrial protein [Burkholderia ubonensis]|uniref:fimbrial protein n=1 Tax=Burkholderia ubonensis TaxID=101571 RepID=UPI0009B30AAC|nr:fimbrial protein [Burkholderia ubonensis]